MERDITEFFNESQEGFMIYVVEHKFTIGRGNEYFKSYRGKPNFISTEKIAKTFISKVLFWIEQKIPHIGSLIELALKNSAGSAATITDVISLFSKIFSVHEHQAAGPEVIDPIIIQEGQISKKTLAQLITLHKSSVLKPTIIILLSDNDFTRVQGLLKNCPHGVLVKMIRNNGSSEIFRIINNGLDNINDFIDLFSRQCFSACSRTPRGVLYNDEWAEDSIIKLFSPSMLKIRTSLLIEEKASIKDDISVLINKLSNFEKRSHNEKLLNSFICMANLFKVYCHDTGGQQIKNALTLSKEINNDLLNAHVYRYSFFMSDYAEKDKILLLKKAEQTFIENNIYDHAIYCKNNYITRQFYTDSVKTFDFDQLKEEAVFNVPGLVGMSSIFNNAGVAYLYNAQPEKALEYFNQGLEYSSDRIVQKLGLLTNSLIAKEYSYQNISENEIRIIVKSIFDSNLIGRLPFIALNYIMNCISVSMTRFPLLFEELFKAFPINNLIQNAFTSSSMGSGNVARQLTYLDSTYDAFSNYCTTNVTKKSKISGKKLQFIDQYGYNPIVFYTWL